MTPRRPDGPVRLRYPEELDDLRAFRDEVQRTLDTRRADYTVVFELRELADEHLRTTAQGCRQTRRNYRCELVAGVPAPSEAIDVPRETSATADDISGFMRALVRQRKMLRLTRADVAVAMGVSASRIEQIENRASEYTEIGTITRYVTALGGRLRLTARFPEEP